MRNKNFEWSDTTTSVLEGINLEGKNIIVTGGTSGLGFETARALASHGANVTVTARTKEKGESCVQQLKELTGKECEYGVLELSKFDTVYQFVDQWKEQHEKLDILINNAGTNSRPLERTKEGYELIFATNHLGHFLLTNLLSDLLVKAASARVSVVSSAGHMISDVHFDDINIEQRDYVAMKAYGQSKTANILFANEFDRKFKEKGVRAFSLHPGAIATNITRYATDKIMKADIEIVGKFENSTPMKTIQQGASTQVWAATAPELEGEGGIYLINNHIATPGNDMGENYVDYAFNEENEQKLWKISNEMLETDF